MLRRTVAGPCTKLRADEPRRWLSKFWLQTASVRLRSPPNSSERALTSERASSFPGRHMQGDASGGLDVTLK
eukprot:scaffold3271_cov60-Phaeocystis_antarctica.AAC.6